MRSYSSAVFSRRFSDILDHLVAGLQLHSGLAAGCISIAVTLYVAECSPAKLRGSFVGTVCQFGYQLGSVISFWAGYGMHGYKSPFNVAWRVSNAIQIPIGILFFVMSFWYPESPVSIGNSFTSIGSLF